MWLIRSHALSYRRKATKGQLKRLYRLAIPIPEKLKEQLVQSRADTGQSALSNLISNY